MTRRMLIGLVLVSMVGSASYVGPRFRLRDPLRRTAVALAEAVSGAVSAQTRRPLQPDDIFALKTVGDPRISPDGAWGRLHGVVT